MASFQRDLVQYNVIQFYTDIQYAVLEFMSPHKVSYFSRVIHTEGSFLYGPNNQFFFFF